MIAARFDDHRGEGAPMVLRDESMPAAAHPSLRLSLHGAPRLVDADGRVHSLERRDAAILALLSLDGATRRARLLDLLWPDAEPDAARNTLRQRLFQLKRRAGRDLVTGTELLALAPDVVVDAEAAVATAAPADAQLLAGLDYADCAAFDDWLAQQRQRAAERQREALVAQAEAAQAQGRLADAIALAERLVTHEPLQEHAHRRLMRLHYLRGDRGAAIAAFERCERVLKDELGTRPDAETLALLATVESSRPALPAKRAPLPATILRPPRLIGRERELDAMRLAWDGGAAFLLLGEAGVGKSRLLAELATEAPGSLHVAARPGDAGVPYAALARLLRALAERRPAALEAAPRALLAAVLPERGEPGSDAGTLPKAALQTAMAAVLRAAADAAIDAVLLDDLHFADDASLELVLGLADAEPAVPTRWGFAQRAAEGGEAAHRLRAELVATGRLASIELAPLDLEAIAALVDSLGLPGLQGAPLAPQLAQRTGGNPLFILETLKQWVGAPAAAALPRPLSVGQLIERRLRQLSPQALAVARLAAVAGGDFSVALAERLLGTATLELADAWQELEQAQVFRGAAFAHDLVYETALACVPLALRERLHGQIAAALEAAAADVARVAFHWGRSLDAERAIPALRAAARAALDRFQRPTAAAHLERVVELACGLGRSAEAFEVQHELVQLLQAFDTGPRHEAAVDRLLALAGSPAERAQAHLARAVLCNLQGRPEVALAPLDAAGSEAQAGTREQAEVLNVRGVTLRRLGRIDGSLQAHRAAVELARRLDDQSDLAPNLNNLALALLEANDAAQAAAAFEEAARLEREPMTRARMLNNLAIAMEESGQLQSAFDTRRLSMSLLRGQEGTDFARAHVLVSLAANARMLQRYADALALLDEAAVIGLEPSHWRAGNLPVQYALTWIELGAWRQADAAIDEAATYADGRPDSELDVLQVRLAYCHARSVDTGALLAQATQALDTRGDRRRLRPLAYRAACTLPPAEAIALAQRELDAEATCGNRAAQIAYATALARAQLARRDAAAALVAAQRANEAMRTATSPLITPTAVRFALFEAQSAVGEFEIAKSIGGLAEELRTIAEQQVPAEHRQGFLRGVALNRRILQAEAEHAARGARVVRLPPARGRR
jgi:DNA-binding SARP family transcriptional activator